MTTTLEARRPRRAQAGINERRGVMSTRTKETLFTVAYGCVLFQFFAMLATTLAVFELDAPGMVQTAALFASIFLGVAALVVMSLRPRLERELLRDTSSRGTRTRVLTLVQPAKRAL